MEKEKDSVDNYSTYILEFVRNDGITSEEKEEENTFNNYLIFGYFDLLHCRKLAGKDKKYVNYLSIVNVFEEELGNKTGNKDYKVANKTLSLYCKSGADQEDVAQANVDFFSIQSEGTALSDTPFLGVIQISLCMDSYKLQASQKIEDVEIDTFLRNCEDWILERADAIKSADADSLMQRALFRSSTTGDFCLVIRTNLIRLIYDIAIALNGTQNDADEAYTTLTYTNVGVECKWIAGKGYATLGEDVVNINSQKIALRFSADKSIRGELQQYIQRENKKDKIAIEGLFGRYEYVLTIGMREFADLYPYLCECKLGKVGNGTNKSPLAAILSEALARNINERILIQLEADAAAGTEILSGGMEISFAGTKRKQREGNKRKQEIDELFSTNNELFDKIEEIKKYRNVFQEEHFAFQDLIRGMIEIYNSFSTVGMDKESYINWRIFHTDMYILSDCIIQMIKYYEKWANSGLANELDKKCYRGTVLEDWRDNLNAINRYTTLVQNINYQTYQSPNYEIQTSIDAEKFMVAYREFMRMYITKAMEMVQEKEEEKEKFRVLPLIYPNLTKKKVSVTAPFMLKRPLRDMKAREIICTVPSFEYFARLYDLLPWIIHETSHHVRVIDREDRNEFVADYIFSYIFKMLMSKTLRRLSEYDLYEIHYGKVEKYIVDCMTYVAKQEIFDQKDSETYNFEMLLLQIEKWLRDRFPLGAGYEASLPVEEEKKLRKRTFQYWLDACRKEDILTQGNLYRIWEICENETEVGIEEKEKLASQLLEKYYNALQEKWRVKEQEFRIDKICLEDMYNELKLEKKLEKLAEVAKYEPIAVREYYEQTIALYRIMKISFKGNNEKRNGTDKYLKKVFQYYKENYERTMGKKNILISAASMHMMRNLGLLREDPKDFVRGMAEIFRNEDNVHIMENKEFKQRTYLEAYADVLMATSLQLTGFGYCRQILQTVSDAKLTERKYEYDDINYERIRTVAAVLLAESQEDRKPKTGEWREVDASELVEKALEYCEFMIKHIYKEISEKKTVMREDKEYEITENEWRLLRELLEMICEQMERFIIRGEDQISEVLLLDILLHGEGSNNINPKVKEKWDEHKNVADLCDNVRYNFWRLSCFCKGIVNIVKNEKIIVSEKLFCHMQKIRNAVKGGKEIGGVWKSDNKFLIPPKCNVGEFYNNPAQVYEKTPDLKLDNTLEFIQNYYYYNRFRVVNNNFDFVSK